jgi:hypothetical protein
MKNGQELQVFIEDLLRSWRKRFHTGENSKARSIGLAKTQLLLWASNRISK